MANTFFLLDKSSHNLNFVWKEWITQTMMENDSEIFKSEEELFELLKKQDQEVRIFLIGDPVKFNVNNFNLKQHKIYTTCSVEYSSSLTQQILISNQISTEKIFVDFFPDEVDSRNIDLEIIKSYIQKVDDIIGNIKIKESNDIEKENKSLFLIDKKTNKTFETIFNILKNSENWETINLNEENQVDNLNIYFKNNNFSEIVYTGNNSSIILFLCKLINNKNIKLCLTFDELYKTRFLINGINFKYLKLYDLNMSLRSTIQDILKTNNQNNSKIIRNEFNFINSLDYTEMCNKSYLLNKFISQEKRENTILFNELNNIIFNTYKQNLKSFSYFLLPILANEDSSKYQSIYDNIISYLLENNISKHGNYDNAFLLADIINRYPNSIFLLIDRLIFSINKEKLSFLTSLVFQIQIAICSFKVNTNNKKKLIIHINNVSNIFKNHNDFQNINFLNTLYTNDFVDFEKLIFSKNINELTSGVISRSLLFKFRECFHEIVQNKNDFRRLYELACKSIEHERKTNRTGFYTIVCEFLFLLYFENQESALKLLKDSESVFMSKAYTPYISELLHHSILCNASFLVAEIHKIIITYHTKDIILDDIQILLDVISIFNGEKPSDNKYNSSNLSNLVSPFINLSHLYYIAFRSPISDKNKLEELKISLIHNLNKDQYLINN
tara:strand:- start:2866 stop:4878 length:2013 start_codon:yes stop_codon:yes gene_type:complete